MRKNRNRAGSYEKPAYFPEIRRDLHAGQSVILLVIAGIFYALWRWVIHPINQIVTAMMDNESVKVNGVQEINYLAETYDRLSSMNRASQEKLSYEATHDPLTGIYNRGAFEKYRDQETNYALILVDVDHFKSINDTFGHDMGDRVLKKVAELLQHRFRSNDYVCRIGGDEFAVIMIHAGSFLKDLEESKIRDVQKTLAHPEGNLPVVTLSVGVAFSDRQNPKETIFKDADSVLYDVKEKGGGDIRFFE